MYSQDFNEQDQVNVEAEWAGGADDSTPGYVQFDFNLDPHPSCNWQIHIIDLDGNKLRVATASSTTSQDRIVQMVLNGRFDTGFDPSEIYGFWIEKW